MTTATLGPVSGNFTIVGFALVIVIGFVYGAVLWMREGQMDRHEDRIHGHDEQLALLAGRIAALAEFLGVEINDPIDDSPEAMQADEPDTDEFPAVQPGELTEPMPLIVDPTPAVQARRDAAWDQQRPSPVPRGKSADWVEEAIKGFDFSGRER